MRRYAVNNDLKILATLTVAGADRGRAAFADAVKRLMRRSKNGLQWTFPFVWVIENGQRSNRTHAHVMVPPAAASDLLARWRLGNTDRRWLETTDDIRSTAYYITKDLPIGCGQQIRTARGFKPKPEVFDFKRADDMHDFLAKFFADESPRVRHLGPGGVPIGYTLFWDNDGRGIRAHVAGTKQ